MILWQRHISRWLGHKSNLQGCSEGCLFQWSFWALGRWTSGHLGDYLHGLWGSSSIISTQLTALFGFGSMGHYLLHLVAFTLVALPVSLHGNKVMEVTKANRSAGHITFWKKATTCLPVVRCGKPCPSSLIWRFLHKFPSQPAFEGSFQAWQGRAWSSCAWARG